MAAPKKSRKSPRAQVSLVARYRSPTAFEFVQEECFDLSLGGMFIRSPAPAPAGTLIKLECDVNGASGKIRGVARVVWLREHSSDNQPAGMGVKFVKLDPGARETIAEVLEQLGAQPDERDTVRPPAPGSVPAAARTSAPAPSSVPAAARTSAPVPSSVPAAARTSAPAGAPAAASNRPSGATSGSGTRVDEPVSAPPPRTPSAPASANAPLPAVAAAEAPKPRPSPRPGPMPSAKGELHDKVTPIEMPIPAAVAASIARTASGKPERQNVRMTPSPRAARTAGPDARQEATLPPSSAAGSHSFVFGALALAGAVTLFIVFSSQQSRGPDVAAPQPAAVALPVVAPVAEAPAPSAAPAPTPAVEPPAKYVLDIATTPNGARVTAGDRVLVTPGQLDLGQLDEPVQLTAESDGFEPAVATIDRVGFMREDGAMHRRIELNLTAKAPEPVPAPAAEIAAAQPAPKLAPVAAPSPKAAPAETPTASRSHRARAAQAKPAADAPVKPTPAVAAAPPVLAITKAADPAAAPADAPPTAAVAPAPVAAAAPVAVSKPVPEPTPVARPVLAATPVAAPEATPAGQPAQAALRPATPLETATACLTRGDNPCVIRALEGKAKSPRELELLIETYRATGDQRKAEASMRVYVDNYPSERRASNYRSVLER